MKWMYLEQETKEAYLRAILCDPPEVIEQKDNDELGTASLWSPNRMQERAMQLQRQSLKRKRKSWKDYVLKCHNL